MGKVLPLIFLLVALYAEPRGSTLRVQGNGFSFSVTEPDGWSINFRSAAQIANFVMHPEDSTWREATVVAFARFVRKAPQETLRTFIQSSLEEFQDNCPFHEVQDVRLEVKGSQKFFTKVLDCPGIRHEIVAVTEVPGFFATFILSSNHENELQSARGSFQDLLSSFVWSSQKPARESHQNKD